MMGWRTGLPCGWMVEVYGTQRGSEREHELERAFVLSIYGVIKNCPRYWKVVLRGPKLNVSSASLLGAQ